MAPQRSNDPKNFVEPRKYEEYQDQTGGKIMAIDGKILPVWWFRNTDGDTVSVNRSKRGEARLLLESTPNKHELMGVAAG